ncbi:MAG: dual specificity protein phosphatase family protein [Myxococcales bacterium]|nr:dual specificity protein phosphatase family protein [Myxococcales bacterium]
MSRALLFTQCLQRDFVDRLGPHDPLPNRLHVGAAESARLLGPDARTGPVAQLFGWARRQPTDALEVVHLRDAHDAADARQAAHLDRFGAHCLRGSPGADLVAGLGEAVPDRPNERFVDCLTLNDFEDTTLASVLAPWLAAPTPPRAGVVGVWTDAKVTFLLYELATRCGLTELATCSALTASASRTQHFNALSQLQRLLGVRVFDSVGDFTRWLVPDGPAVVVPPLPPGVGPTVTGAPLAAADADVVAGLFRESAEVELRPLAGGFSGAAVYRALSRDALGHDEAPTVLKLGPRATLAAERAAFERVEHILGNHAPAVRGFVEHGDRAGLRYAYAAMGQGEVRPFKALYEGGASDAEIERVLRTVFESILGPFYRAARYERLPLLAHYGFAPRHADGIARQVAALLGGDGHAPTLTLPDGVERPNLVGFYRDVLPALSPDADAGFHRVSYVHGDLNGANMLVDGQRNVWVIDFFHTARAHVLKDLAKLENDLLYIFTPVTEATFAQATALSAALAGVRDLRAPLPERVEGVTDPELRRAWRTVRLLRSLGAELVDSDRDPLQLRIASLRYAAHTLFFDESDAWQRRWALAAACDHAAAIGRALDGRSGLRVDWLPDDARAPGRLGLTLCPGRRDRRRDLQADLDALQRAGATVLVSLLTDDEVRWAGVEGLPEAARGRGVAWWSLPIADQGVPGHRALDALLDRLGAALAAGERVVVHCMGGLGRSGLVAACALVDAGWSAADAIEAVRAARDPRAVETPAQEAFVAEFAALRG